MLQQTGRAPTCEYGVSEVIGAVMLIAVVAIAIAIISVSFLSQPAPQKIPALDAVISNTGNTIQIYHNGGDSLQQADFSVLVNGKQVDQGTLWGGSPDSTWSSGEALSFNAADVLGPGASANDISTVQIVYGNSGSASTVLSSANFGNTGMASTALTISATAGSGGSISPAGTVSVVYGESQTFSITPTTGFHITEVLVDGSSVGSVSSYTFSDVTASHSISAVFSINTYTITPATVDHGTITPATAQTVNYGSTPSFSFTPAAGYRLGTVTVDGVEVTPDGTSYTFPAVTIDHALSATFVPDTYVIIASAGAGGSITPSGSVNVSAGNTQAFTLLPNTGYHVADVLVDGVSNGTISSYSFTNVQADHTISATFAINRYNINATAGPHGSISPGNVTVDYNGSQTFTIAPSTGYHIADVLVDGISNGTISSYSFTNVQADHTISATFAINRFTINATSGGNGTVMPGNVTVDYGGSQEFTFTPNTGYYISNVLVDGGSQGAIANYTFTNVIANHTIAATFGMIAPVANFTGTPVTGGIPLSVSFTDLSTNNPTSWVWNFGDAMGDTISYEQNPTHVYTYPGNYSVELTATNDGGSNKSSREGYIFAYVPAVANFTANITTGPLDPVSDSLTVKFTSTSTGSPSSHVWDFGDSYVLSGNNPSPAHSYGATGLYSVNLTVANTFSSSYLLRQNYINVTPPPPVSAFETYDNEVDMNPRTSGFAPLQVFFYDLTSESPTSWVWDFGDGNITTITKDGSHEYGDIYHTFTSAGSYNVSLTAYNDWGSSTSYKTITVTALTITASSGANGNVTPSGVTTVNYGATPTYTITPITGYHVTDVLVNGTSVGAVTSYTFPAVTTNKTISATFAINTYTVTSSVASGQGSISPLGVTTYDYGDTPTYTITRNSTYSISSVLVDGSSVGAVSSYTFPALSANHTITAAFTKNPSVQIYYQPFSTTTGWPYDSWTISSSTYVTLSTSLRNGSSGRSVRDAYTAYFGRTIPTTGYDEIYVRYKWATAGLTTTQYATAQDSTSGTYTEFARQTGNLASLTIVNTSRPNAGNNSNYALRWQIYASQTTDYLYVDDVQVFGTAI